VDKLRQAEQLQKNREIMIEQQLKGRGIKDLRILAVFRKVSREKFLSAEFEAKAYDDHPIPIGYNQTISQPYIVALMSENLELAETDKALEIGTGSGYQTAILAELVQTVYSVECIDDLHGAAKIRLRTLGYQNIQLKCDDGRKGWADFAPFDKIMVTAAAEKIPNALTDQLKEGGKIIIPIGREEQDLVLGRKDRGVLVTRQLIPVRFVPLMN